MPQRKGLSKKTRFEVFKRDKFTCQYCGKSAPDVILQVDHITPVAGGGGNEIVNLVTSCQNCNAGKSDRLLSDESTLAKQKAQLGLLQERREQLEMMVEWQRGLAHIEDEIISSVINFWQERTGYGLTDEAVQDLAKLVRRFGVGTVLAAIRIACGQYLEYSDSGVVWESANVAFDYVGRICTVEKRSSEKPYLRDLYYIRGILRKRLSFYPKNYEWKIISDLESAYIEGASLHNLKEIAVNARSWTQWREAMSTLQGEGIRPTIQEINSGATIA